MPGSIMGGREDMFKDMDNMMNSMMRGFGGNMVSSILVYSGQSIFSLNLRKVL